MASETTVGSIVGFLRLDASQWNASLAEAGAAAERLGSADPNIDVHADNGRALAALAETEAVAAQVDSLDPTIDVHANTAGAEVHLASAQRSTIGLLDAVLLLGPALVPLAGAAAGLGIAFGGLGAAGLLAFVGVKNAIKNGSAAGVEFKDGIDKVKGNLDLLAATAAGGILDGFTGAINDLQPKIPAIQNGIGALSIELGQVMRPAADGIATAFIKLLPLMTDVADYAIRGARAFDQWAQGDGLQKFGGYAMAVLPQVLSVLGQLAELVGKVAGAFSGWGGMVLSAVGTLASLLNSLPTGVLSVIASGGLAVYSAFKTFGLIRGMVSGLGGALTGLAANMQRLEASSAGAALQRVATGMRAVGTAGSIANIAVGGIAAVLGVAVLAWSIYKQRQQEAKAAQEAMTQAIQEDSGALGENAQKVLAKSIADGDLIGKSKALGISQDELAAAFTKGGTSLDDVTAKIKQNGTVTVAASGAAGGMGKSQRVLSSDAQGLLDNIGKLNGQIKNGKKEYDANKLAAKALSDTLDTAGGAMSTAELAQISLTNATKDQAKAINALNQSLDAEISKQLQLHGGLTGEAAARLQMVGVLKKQKSSTDLNTDSGVKQRQAIESAVGQLQSYMSTQEKAGKTTAQATETYKSQAAALLDSIAHTDGANSSTYKYAQTLLKLPKDVSTQVGTSGTSVAVSQLKGMQKVADKLGVTRIEVPASTPNAKNVTQLLNNIGEAALSADGKSVSIAADSPKALATKLKLDGITTAAVSADGKSVNIPTRTLNQPRTVAQIEEVLNKTKDKSMTVTANGNRLDYVLGKLGLIDRTGHSRSFTVQAYMVTTTIQRHVDERLARGRGYASGTTNATEGFHPLGERGMELVIGPQVGYLAAGSTVLNHQDTMRTLAGDPAPMMHATGARGTAGGDRETNALLRKAIITMERTAMTSAGAAAAVPAALASGMTRRQSMGAQSSHMLRRRGGVGS